jgi:hypothetical protein
VTADRAGARLAGADRNLVAYSEVRPVDPAHEAQLVQLADAGARYWAAMDDPEASEYERYEAALALQEAEASMHELQAEPARDEPEAG